MKIHVFDTKIQMGEASAKDGAQVIKNAIHNNGKAAVILATGASQFDTIAALVKISDIDWSKVTIFHLDEYIGISSSHPASFRKYLKDRFTDKVPHLSKFVPIDGEAHLEQELARLSQEIASCFIDVAFIGIGENGHLAFNDPPADFDTEEAFIAVDLDEVCRKQQMEEGWFPTIGDVPTRAISMSIQQILKSKTIICSVPDERKAKPLQSTIEGLVTNLCPSSILQQHANCSLYLDQASAILLNR